MLIEIKSIRRNVDEFQVERTNESGTEKIMTNNEDVDRPFRGDVMNKYIKTSLM